MTESLFNKIYTPDVLNCLANLSNDEVFTPPEVVNQMLDMLPQELFSDPTTTFLDPACKTGVFLREIAKRLIKGLEPQFPDLQQRLDHIFHNQLFGIAITELTSLLSRRGVYCSKYPNGPFSVTKFDDQHADGNIRYKPTQHSWSGGKCVFCGASQSQYDRGDALETHAYEFIHNINLEKIFNMKFDVIIGNPPYQLNTGGAQAQAIPLYHKFVSQAKKLKPRYLTMIIPSRWFTGGFGLDSFRHEMLHDASLRIIHDYTNANDCFPGVEIKGGVNYFLWDRDNKGLCSIYTHDKDKITSFSERSLLEENCDVFIRYNQAIPILRKVQCHKERTIDTYISSQRPFGIPTNFCEFSDKRKENSLKIYANKKIGYLPPSFKITKNSDIVDKWKLFTPKAIGSGDGKTDYVKPILGEPNSICTETYVVFGTYDKKETALNVCSYINTKFFHFLLTLRKNTQDALAKVYSFIPIQDFSKPWSDEELYAKYDLTQEEIDFIESMIRPME